MTPTFAASPSLQANILSIRDWLWTGPKKKKKAGHPFLSWWSCFACQCQNSQIMVCRLVCTSHIKFSNLSRSFSWYANGPRFQKSNEFLNCHYPRIHWPWEQEPNSTHQTWLLGTSESLLGRLHRITTILRATFDLSRLPPLNLVSSLQRCMKSRAIMLRISALLGGATNLKCSPLTYSDYVRIEVHRVHRCCSNCSCPPELWFLTADWSS